MVRSVPPPSSLVTTTNCGPARRADLVAAVDVDAERVGVDVALHETDRHRGELLPPERLEHRLEGVFGLPARQTPSGPLELGSDLGAVVDLYFCRRAPGRRLGIDARNQSDRKKGESEGYCPGGEGAHSRALPRWERPPNRAAARQMRRGSPRHRSAQVLERDCQLARSALVRELDRLDEIEQRLLHPVPPMRHLRQRSEHAGPVLPTRSSHVECLAERPLGVGEVADAARAPRPACALKIRTARIGIVDLTSEELATRQLEAAPERVHRAVRGPPRAAQRDATRSRRISAWNVFWAKYSCIASTSIGARFVSHTSAARWCRSLRTAAGIVARTTSRRSGCDVRRPSAAVLDHPRRAGGR